MAMRHQTRQLRAVVDHVEQLHAQTTSTRELELHGFRLSVTPGVFDPDFSNIGDLLARTMQVFQGNSVLDLGTGSGIQALVAARVASQVVAIDLQQEAAACARANVARNGMSEKIDVRCGDLFDPLEENEQFDAILFNFPFVPWTPTTKWQQANFDPGHRLLRRFLGNVGSFLAPGGNVTMTWSDIGDTPLLRALAAKAGLSCKTLVERKSAGVKHYVFGLRRHAPEAS